MAKAAQHEGDALGGAQVGQPVPGEHALDADHQAVAERGDGGAEGVGGGRQVGVEGGAAVGVENVEVKGPGVQVAAAVESVRLGVEAHARGLRGMGRP
jgi:hypothetical protein